MRFSHALGFLYVPSLGMLLSHLLPASGNSMLTASLPVGVIPPEIPDINSRPQMSNRWKNGIIAMMVTLQIATNATFDEFIARATKDFFSGSEAEARENVGPFEESETSFILAYVGEEPVATVTVRWNPHYPPFRAENIPFIQNIEVRYDLRGQGYGSHVLAAVEQLLGERSPKVGICVGLYDVYGPAQRLYAKRGYLPDGRGACHRFTPLRRGEVLTLDDDHLLWLVKELRPAE
jgi:GNAT superfamily N-acetyltransferase